MSRAQSEECMCTCVRRGMGHKRKDRRKRRECSYVLSVPSACSPSYSSVSTLLIFHFDSKFKGAAKNISPERRFDLTHVFDWAARAYIFHVGELALAAMSVARKGDLLKLAGWCVLSAVSEYRQAGRF